MQKQRASSLQRVTCDSVTGVSPGSKLLTRQRAWQLRFPEKRRAHEAVRQALLKGILVKGVCQDCGSADHVDAHHDNYARPLEVTWLCRRHHMARHRRKITKGPRD